MGTLRILSSRGDDRYSWETAPTSETGEADPEVVAALREAERIFEEHRARGASAFRIAPDKTPQRLDAFDPAAETIVVVPRVVGG